MQCMPRGEQLCKVAEERLKGKETFLLQCPKYPGMYEKGSLRLLETTEDFLSESTEENLLSLGQKRVHHAM